MPEKQQTIGIAILTLNSQKHLAHCIPPFLQSSLKPKVLVVDSTSDDDTVATARKMGAEIMHIQRSEFNHGLTREKARKHLNTDIVVMLTPDAYAINDRVLEILVSPLLEGKAAVAYARQIPHEGASFFEAFPRQFNYPSVSHIRGFENIDEYGVYTFFCSNSCAAYSNKAMDEIGGFKSVLLGEDTVAVSELLRRGYKVAYIAEAMVKHSHRYTIKEEFFRYFDTGLARMQYKHLMECPSNDSRRGKEYVKEMIRCLIKEKPHLLPYAFMHTAMKWLGYKIGQSSLGAPDWFKKALSSQKFYWTSNEYLKNQLGRKSCSLD